MNYTKHYAALIDRARGRLMEGYSEGHHIVPRCLGGSDEPENIVRLTAEEHYVAHQLLVKMHPGDHRLLWALSAMTGGSKRQPGRQNKRYGWLRRRFAKYVGDRSRGRVVSAETRARMSAARLGMKMKPHSEETRRKMSEAAKGRPKSEAHRRAASLARLGKKRQPHTEETKRKMSVANKAAAAGRDQSVFRTPEYRAKQSANSKAMWAARKAQE